MKYWRKSTILGAIAFLFTFFFSLTNNTWQTSLFRAGTGFLLFFSLGMITLFALQELLIKKAQIPVQQNAEVEGTIDMRKENRSEANMEETAFQAIPLQSLHNGEPQMPAEEAAVQATRTWIQENREG